MRRWAAAVGGDLIRLAVKVVPGAARDAIDGWLGDSLKLRVTAPPERGKANAAVERLVAATLGIARSRVAVVVGHGSPRKVLEVADASESEVLGMLSEAGFRRSGR